MTNCIRRMLMFYVITRHPIELKRNSEKFSNLENWTDERRVVLFINITRRPASTGIFFAQLHILINFCKRLKTKQLLMLVFKECLQRSIRPLILYFMQKGITIFR